MSAESAAMDRINDSLKNIGMEMRMARQERAEVRTRESAEPYKTRTDEKFWRRREMTHGKRNKENWTTGNKKRKQARETLDRQADQDRRANRTENRIDGRTVKITGGEF